MGDERHAVAEAQRELERISTKAKRPADHQMLAEQSGLILFPARRKVRIPQIGKRHSINLPKPGRGYVVSNRLSEPDCKCRRPLYF
jgi:hypothetical protein